MSDQIRDGLERSFVKDRLVVWRDPEGRFREEFDAIEIPKVTKLVADRNEFALKYRVLIEEPDTYFLIYRPGTPPPDEQNWLLDIEIGYGLFTADKADLIRSELNLPLRYAELIREHIPVLRRPAAHPPAEGAHLRDGRARRYPTPHAGGLRRGRQLG